eukprot:m.20889 g.20889  ORF g.20889 m.20889 type:complete len:67 (-) comp10326_c0_seq1:590-790(-)
MIIFYWARVKLKWDVRSDNDEGDFDTYTTSTVEYKGKEIWRHATSEHSNIGGAWGSTHVYRCPVER